MFCFEKALDLYSIIYWSGEDADKNMTIETFKDETMGQPLDFHSGIALSKDQTKAFVCDIKESNTLSMFQFENAQWNKAFTYSENKFPLLMVQLSHDEVIH